MADTHQLAQANQLVFSVPSDDTATLKQIQSIHAPDGREIDLKPILQVIEDIFNRITPSIDAIIVPATQTQKEVLDNRTNQASFFGNFEALPFLIDQISRELAYKCWDGVDRHVATMSILNMLSTYSWEAKLVLCLSAFAASYGEFWLVAQTYTSNQLSKSVAILKLLPGLFTRSSMLKPQFDAIRDLSEAILDMTKCVSKFKDLPSQYITADFPELSTALARIPIAVFWTMRSIVTLACQISGFMYLASTTEAFELSSLVDMVRQLHSELLALLNSCHKHIDENRNLEAYRTLGHLFGMKHLDNMEVLKALFNAKADPFPLIDGTTKEKVDIDVLRRKHVLLLISGFDIPQEEVSILEQIYNEHRENLSRQSSEYEVVWLPIINPNVPWNESMQKQFNSMKELMTWYTVQHPLLIEKVVIKFMKEEWGFDNEKPMLVVLDPYGMVASPNALHMMWIWGSEAFPFTFVREETLWRQETWRLELLVDNIDPVILNWIAENRYICLYGGEDIEWIRKFTTTARAVAEAGGISLGMVYVGKSDHKERVRQNIITITAENLSHCWQDMMLIWYFWVRVRSMCYSKDQLKKSIYDDPVMQEVMTIHSYDVGQGGWVLLSRGSTDIARAKGNIFLTCFQEYDLWKSDVQEKGFVPAVRDRLVQTHAPHDCHWIMLCDLSTSVVPDRVACTECGRIMEKFILFKCCIDD